MEREWRTKPLVTSVRMEYAGEHRRLHVWVHGAKVGTLLVRAEEAEAMVHRLLGPDAAPVEPF